MGYDLSDSELSQIRYTEKIVPNIRVLTYNDVLAFIQNTISLIHNIG